MSDSAIEQHYEAREHKLKKIIEDLNTEACELIEENVRLRSELQDAKQYIDDSGGKRGTF